jgi:hypothetical protein
VHGSLNFTVYDYSTRNLHLVHDPFGMWKKVTTALREHNAPPRPFEQGTFEFVLERLDGMADGALSEEQLLAGESKTSGACQHYHREQLTTVQDFSHTVAEFGIQLMSAKG